MCNQSEAFALESTSEHDHTWHFCGSGNALSSRQTGCSDRISGRQQEEERSRRLGPEHRNLSQRHCVSAFLPKHGVAHGQSFLNVFMPAHPHIYMDMHARLHFALSDQLLSMFASTLSFWVCQSSVVFFVSFHLYLHCLAKFS